MKDIFIIVGDMYRVDECNSISRIETSEVTFFHLPVDFSIKFPHLKSVIDENQETGKMRCIH